MGKAVVDVKFISTLVILEIVGADFKVAALNEKVVR